MGSTSPGHEENPVTAHFPQEPLGKIILFSMKPKIVRKIVLSSLAGCCLIFASISYLVSRPQIFATEFTNSIANQVTVSPKRLRNIVKHLSENMRPRDFRHPNNLDRVAEYLANELRSTGAEMSSQFFTNSQGRFQNVIASYGKPGSDEVLVVGAHYDTERDLPGADDNASGIAGLLELGRLLGNSQLEQQILLVAFTLEEPPFFGTDNMGSAVFADSLKQQDIAVELMISLEMIGYYSDEPGSQAYPLPLMKLIYPDTGNFIAVIDKNFSSEGQELRESIRKYTDLPAISINAPEFVEGIDFSDHRNFWYWNYPAVMVTDTAFLRNLTYHTRHDTADRLDYYRMSQVVLGVYRHLIHRAS